MTELIELEVIKHLNKACEHDISLQILCMDPESRDHIIQIGTSVLSTKWEVGYPGGSFVQAVVGNDLMGAFGRADEVNRQAIGFYVSLLYNLAKP